MECACSVGFLGLWQKNVYQPIRDFVGWVSCGKRTKGFGPMHKVNSLT